MVKRNYKRQAVEIYNLSEISGFLLKDIPKNVTVYKLLGRIGGNLYESGDIWIPNEMINDPKIDIYNIICEIGVDRINRAAKK